MLSRSFEVLTRYTFKVPGCQQGILTVAIGPLEDSRGSLWSRMVQYTLC